MDERYDEVVADPRQASVPQVWSSVTVVDGCAFGRLGLMAALTTAALPAQVWATLDSEAFQAVRQSAGGHCLVLRLPLPTATGIAQLLALGDVPWATLQYRAVIVLSPYAPTAVRQVVDRLGVQCDLYVLSSRLTPRVLIEAVTALSDIPAAPRRAVAYVLSDLERCALRGTLVAEPVYRLARRREVSVKTIYAQRNMALKKLGVRSLAELVKLWSPQGNVPGRLRSIRRRGESDVPRALG
ncbi:response regulator transcription factor [Serratia marcescens]|nr:response regulator transcription factor [Serratia marcescens]MBH2766644.1 response regulator transcription factor [Serratia marcescens]MBH2766704.1 response regulator transcription factor [Serratia marcescens]